jgi:hypothetical protein
MGDDVNIPWDRITCRSIIDHLRDGVPPELPEAIEFLSVGCEGHLARAKAGLEKAKDFRYDATILEGRYGIGKSHFLNRVKAIAQHQGFVVKQVELGNGRVYFNNPDGIYRHILGQDKPPTYRYIWAGDHVVKFIGQLKVLTEISMKEQKAKGLVILLDEMENTFDWNNLPRFPSRVKAYRFLDALFHGYAGDTLGDNWIYLTSTYVVLAITPGVIERAMAEPDGWWYVGKYIRNPAKYWTNRLPDRLTIEPLSETQSLELAKRIRAVHSVAMNWNAAEIVCDDALLELGRAWCSQGESRDERQLVKQVIEKLELAEQYR